MKMRINNRKKDIWLHNNINILHIRIKNESHCSILLKNIFSELMRMFQDISIQNISTPYTFHSIYRLLNHFVPSSPNFEISGNRFFLFDAKPLALSVQQTR